MQSFKLPMSYKIIHIHVSELRTLLFALQRARRGLNSDWTATKRNIISIEKSLEAILKD